tara:strand:- start:607 stop:882 length:276 start_codon:yes stop_codon:yes gene_type:complete
MNRDYFKEKKTGKKPKGRFTKCCNEEQDRHILNKNKPDEWELIEQHCEDHLIHYPSVIDITPVCCDVCGRLIKYVSKIDTDKERRKTIDRE